MQQDHQLYTLIRVTLLTSKYQKIEVSCSVVTHCTVMPELIQIPTKTY